jgi:nucleoside-diphosphate-sugar epimerase
MVAELERRGYDVDGVDLAAGARPQYGKVWRFQRDVRDFFRSSEQRHYDLVVHLAAVVGGRQMIEGQPLAVAVDLALDAEMFQWALRARPGRVVYFSSSAAYPVGLQKPTRQVGVPDGKSLKMVDKLNDRRLVESDIGLGIIGIPDLTYGWSKLTGELLAQYAEAEGLPVYVLRPFSGYGEDQALDYPFPAFVDRARRRADPFEIWGDGEQARDWIHIDDVIGATLAAVAHDVREPVNLCTGRPTSFNELAKLVTAEAGYSPAFRHLPAMPSGVHYRVGDPTKLLSFYEPKVSLEEGIRRAVQR